MIATALVVAIAAAQAAGSPPAAASEAAAPAASPEAAVPAAAAPAAPATAPTPPADLGQAVAAPAAPQAAAEVRRSAPGIPLKRVRWGIGAASFPNQAGLGGAMEVGADVAWWGELGLRGTVGVALAQTWGSLWLAPEVVWRVGGREDGFGPYLGGGLMLGMAAVADENLALSRGAVGWRAYAAGSAPPDAPSSGSGGMALSPFQFAAGPTAAGGFAIQAGRKVAIDLGIRYGLLFLKTVEHQVTATVALNGVL